MPSATSPDELVDALYSGLNALDVAGLRALFLPTATLVRAVAPMTVHSVDSWLDGLPLLFTDREELELGRRHERLGAVCHCVSRFLIRRRQTKAVLRSGTNCFSAVFDGQRWWLVAATWVLDAPGS